MKFLVYRKSRVWSIAADKSITSTVPYLTDSGQWKCTHLVRELMICKQRKQALHSLQCALDSPSPSICRMSGGWEPRSLRSGSNIALPICSRLCACEGPSVRSPLPFLLKVPNLRFHVPRGGKMFILLHWKFGVIFKFPLFGGESSRMHPCM